MCLKKDLVFYVMKLILLINYWKELMLYSIVGNRESMGWEIEFFLGCVFYFSVCFI